MGKLGARRDALIDLTRPGLGQKPWWSLEGFAVLAEYYTRFEDVRQPFWGANIATLVPIVTGHNHGGFIICTPLNAEYWPIPENSYGAGCAMLRYLVDQALGPGQTGAAPMRTLLDRSSHGDLRPIFRQLGGDDRTEEELMGGTCCPSAPTTLSPESVPAS